MAGAARPFADFLREQRRGDLLEDLTEALHEAVTSVGEHQLPAEVVLKIKIKPAGELGGAVQVQDEIALKLPKPKTPPSVFFITPENNLSKTDPHQTSMQLRDVDSGESRTLRDAG
jgi:hypothetical protein